MAEALLQLKQEVTCSICLEVYKQPKSLTCQHAFCIKCINGLPVELAMGRPIIKCPTCRKPTLFPKNGRTSDIPPAFHVNSMIGLYESAQTAKSKAPSLTKCSRHDRDLEIYCETCKELVCTICVFREHKDHGCGLVVDLVSKHVHEVREGLETIKNQVGVVLEALGTMNTREKEIVEHGESLKREITSLSESLVEAVRHSDEQLRECVDSMIQQKLRTISSQKDEGELILMELKSCEVSIDEELHTNNSYNIFKQKDSFIQWIESSNELASTLKQLSLPTVRDIRFTASPNSLKMVKDKNQIGIVQQLKSRAT